MKPGNYLAFSEYYDAIVQPPYSAPKRTRLSCSGRPEYGFPGANERHARAQPFPGRGLWQPNPNTITRIIIIPTMSLMGLTTHTEVTATAVPMALIPVSNRATEMNQLKIQARPRPAGIPMLRTLTRPSRLRQLRIRGVPLPRQRAATTLHITPYILCLQVCAQLCRM